MPTDVLDAHTFIHRINTIVVKITPILKTFITFISYIILTIFAKRSAKVLNIPRFWICQCYPGFWICLDMSEYATMAFVLYFPIVILVYLNAWLIIFESLFFCNVYTKLEVLVWRKMRLFFGDTKFDFSIVAVRIFVALRIFLVAGFCFRLNTCTSKISNLL